MKILFISTVIGSGLFEALKDINDDSITIEVLYPNDITEERISEFQLKEQIESSDVIVLDIRGGGRVEELVYKLLKNKEKTVVTLLGSERLFGLTKLGAFSMGSFPKKHEVYESMRSPIAIYERIKMVQKVMEIAGKILPIWIFKDAKNYVMLLKYWGFGCKENYKNLILLLCSYCGIHKGAIKPPIEFPEYGIYHPALGIFTEIETYIKASGISSTINLKPTIGILFTGGTHFQQNLSLINCLISEFKEFNVIPVFTNGIFNLKAMKEFFIYKNEPIVDVILRLLWFRLNGGPFGGDSSETIKLLKSIEVPIFSPVTMYLRDVNTWKSSSYGISIIETVADVIWPEMDGSIEPIPIAGLKDILVEGRQVKEVLPIEGRLDRVKNRITKWCGLRKKNNTDKRVAFIIYNYPPGESSVGRAAYLDTFESLEKFLKLLSEQGYNVKLHEKPLHSLIEDYHMVNSGKWLDSSETLKRCFSIKRQKWQEIFDNLTENSKFDLIEHYGQPPGDVMVVEDKILIPAIELGNILIGIQPARPSLSAEEASKISHDKTKPPHYQYIAFYRWLEKEWKADVVVHVGTHGLAEFMKGKEVGLSNDCFPDILIDNLPNLYIYHVVNTSEATIAKRRLYGTLISYNSPPYTLADCYDEYLVLEDLIHEYNEAAYIDPVRAKLIYNEILKKAELLNIDNSDIDSIHETIYRLKRSIIPKGLHTFGKIYDEQEKIDFMIACCRYDRGELKSLNKIIAAQMGYDYNELVRDSKKNIKILAKIDEKVKALVVEFVRNGTIVDDKGLSNKKEDILKTIKLAENLARRFVDNSNEVSSFLDGLKAKYIEPSIGGDVLRNIEALPTGRNIFQFDPTKIPTYSAYLRGKEIAENTIKYFLQSEGRYPDSIGVVLWGFETTQTQGETIGQILAYIGVKIIRRYGQWHPDFEIIPLSELKRPRIDCVITVCGFFREMFPETINLLDKAFNTVANLDEPEEMNYIKKNSKTNLQIIKDTEEIIQEDILHRLANSRIFGPRSGEYGTRMLPLIEDSVWQSEEQLAEIYIESMNYLHAENIHAKKIDKLFRRNLVNIELVSQIRSSNDYEIVDLDHYFEFFGGLSKSVETISGKKPKMLISDTTEEFVRTDSIDKIIEHGIRSRVLNPKWIKEMLKHNVHGGQHIANRIYNLLGLAVTTGAVKNWIWSEVAKKYLFDKETMEALLNNNKWATMEIVNRLFEANKRGYWDANENEIKELQKILLEVEGWLEEKMEDKG